MGQVRCVPRQDIRVRWGYDMHNKCIVVGGGASGMMAALCAARSGARVILLERNEKLGKKMYITGKGRCNVTNASDMEQYQRSIFRNPRFLYAAFAQLDNAGMMSLIWACR